MESLGTMNRAVNAIGAKLTLNNRTAIMSDKILSLEVQKAIASCSIEGDCLRLPSTQWPRDLYLEVKSALTKQGAKYKTGGKFQFHGDIGLKIGMMLNRGVAVDEIKKFQSFYTPKDMADTLAFYGQVEGKTVLEPSAGRGALVESCVRAGCRSIKCIDINPDCVEKLRRDGLHGVVCADFLHWQPPPQLFQRVVMNPPFSKKQDIAHVKKAITCLHADGVLAAIVQANHVEAFRKENLSIFSVRDDAFSVKVKIIQIRR